MSTKILKISQPIQCEGCQEIILGDQYLRCCVCGSAYEIKCTVITESRLKSMTKEQLESWVCDLCRSKLPKGDNVNTPVRFGGGDANVNCRRGANPCYESDNDDDQDSDGLQSLVKEIRVFRQELKATRIKIFELNLTLAKIEAKVDASDKRIDELNARMDGIESKMSKGDEISHTCPSLDTIKELKMQINERDQELLINDIDFTCIQEERGENVYHIVKTLANKIGVSLQEHDLVSAARVGRVPESVAEGGSGQQRPRPIAVRLARRAVRDELLHAARVRRTLTTEGTGLPGSPRRFYINERLTRTNRQLFNKAREAAEKANWRYVWTRDGKIFARQRQGIDVPRHRLRSEDDLKRVFGSPSVGPTTSEK